MEERLSTQETNLKKLGNNLVEKRTGELIRKLKIQAERINQLENDKSLLQKQFLELKKKLKIELPMKKMNNIEEDFVLE